MAPRIYSHSTLEAAVCEAKAIDSLKPRHGKAGPARQGQAGHRVKELYLGHLHATKRETDFEEGAKLWGKVRNQLGAADAKAIEDAVTSFILDQSYPWVVTAQQLVLEAPRYFTMDRREVAADKVALLDGPIFRITSDMSWEGDGPQPIIRDDVRLHMLDWKFHRLIEHVTEPDRNRQLLRYSSAVYANRTEDSCSWIGFARKGYYEHAVFTAGDREQAWQQLVVEPIQQMEEMLANVNPETAARTVGAHCRHCDLFHGCDAAQRYPYVAPWAVDATPETKMVALKLMKQMAAALNQEVKHMVSETGPVDDGDMEAVLEETEQMASSRDDVFRIVGQDIPADSLDRAFMISKTRLEGIMKKAKIKPARRKEMFDELRVTAERKMNSTLKVRTIRQEREKGEPAEGDGEGSA